MAVWPDEVKRCIPHNSALSFSQLKLSELCASLELQAAASATGGAAFRSVAVRPYSSRDPCSETTRLGIPKRDS